MNNWEKLLYSIGLENIIISDNSTPFCHFVSQFDYLIGPPSTSFYDALMLGVTPISINKIDHLRKYYIKEYFEDNNRLMEYVLKPKSIDAIIEIIRKGEKTKTGYLKILETEANYPNCHNSLEAFRDLCLKFKEEKKQNRSTFIFEITIFGMNILYKMKRYFKKEISNSANFLMTKKAIKYIDKLTQ